MKWCCVSIIMENPWWYNLFHNVRTSRVFSLFPLHAIFIQMPLSLCSCLRIQTNIGRNWVLPEAKRNSYMHAALVNDRSHLTWLAKHVLYASNAYHPFHFNRTCFMECPKPYTHCLCFVEFRCGLVSGNFTHIFQDQCSVTQAVFCWLVAPFANMA